MCVKAGLGWLLLASVLLYARNQHVVAVKSAASVKRNILCDSIGELQMSNCSSCSSHLAPSCSRY